jgi:tetratricopeptide (TPR) repeat protein
MNAKKAAVASEKRSAQAVDLYEKAMKSLGKHDYEKAKEQLETFLESHAEERDIAERARLFLAMCVRSLEKRPAYKPKTVDELLNHGVILHNRGEYAEALKFYAQAAEQQPKNEHVLYCIAASEAQRGDVAAALKSLRAAIVASPESRAQAQADADFDSIRDNEEFGEILDAEG